MPNNIHTNQSFHAQ